MKRVSGREMGAILERKGWKLLRVRGAHHIYGRDEPFGRIPVPVHGNRTLKIGIQRSILRDAGLTEDDL